MDITDILSPDSIECGTHFTSKKRVLERLSQIIASADVDLTADEVFEGMIARERLGSTGLGNGVAIPHGRLKHAHSTIGAFVSVMPALNYDSIDGKPVDLLFAMIVPENSTDEHLEILAHLAEMFSVPEFVDKLRDVTDSRDAYRLLTGMDGVEDSS